MTVEDKQARAWRLTEAYQRLVNNGHWRGCFELVERMTLNTLLSEQRAAEVKQVQTWEARHD